MLELTIFILCLIAIYHHVGFPILLKFLKTEAKFLRTCRTWPQITMIIPVYNEEKSIAEKIMNTASLDYPADRLKVVVTLDGCRDNTYQNLKQAMQLPEVRHLNITIQNRLANRGKVAVLNQEISKAESDIIALSDCTSLLSLDALKRVGRHFSDQTVGVVGGSYTFSDMTNSSEQLYWKYQTSIKKGEAALGAPMGMHGAFYAFKKSLSEKLSSNTINDDFILPMRIVAKGYRAIYDTKINCIETESSTAAMNWNRRVRISAGNVQQAIKCKALLSLKQPGIAFCFFSGKFLRAWMPLILVAIFMLSGLAAFEDQAFFYFFLLQNCGLVVVLSPLKFGGKIAKVIRSLRYIIVGHMAGLVGTMRYFFGFENGAWKSPNQ